MRLARRHDLPDGRVESRGDGGRGHRGRVRWPVTVRVTIVVPVSAARAVVEVADDQQGSSGGHPGGDAVVELQLGDRGVRVVRGDQVEVRLRLPGRQVGPDPPHQLGNAALGGPLRRTRERRGGDVRCRDLPAVPGEPDRLGPGAAASVEGRPGRQGADLLPEVRVGLTGGHGRGAIAPPDLVPVLVVERVRHRVSCEVRGGRFDTRAPRWCPASGGFANLLAGLANSPAWMTRRTARSTRWDLG